ncbi:Serine/Threonine protein kinase [Orpheovirus IHUMI-LCC2]|uniref:Serine/Threonine protein kinase n=1 Tax=Orpheovirus IHUMI-LCC2 TaxID=2023057 RepID=A0A2I2L2Y8_9VIRU|nr:Serine/Threonine protein kinase [Orpheovirus IHUMI-LCC2]SNW61905.1 Serine/Threonine protein kinase [Orpheovirus IHUMI-LCC2]
MQDKCLLTFDKPDIRLIEKIGDGTYATVWKTIYNNKIYACKVIKLFQNKQLTKSTLYEFSTLLSLNHPHIISPTLIWIGKHRLWILLDIYTSTITDFPYIKKSSKDWPYIKKIFLYQSLSAIDYMHQRGIWHRDIKPDNILFKYQSIDNTINFCISDFSISKQLYNPTKGNIPSRSRLLLSSEVVSPIYRAPELLLPSLSEEKSYDFGIDIWALGISYCEFTQSVYDLKDKEMKDLIYGIYKLLGNKETLDKLSDQTLKLDECKSKIDIWKECGIMDTNEHRIVKLMLEYNMEDRNTANQILQDPYFIDLPPTPIVDYDTSYLQYLRNLDSKFYPLHTTLNNNLMKKRKIWMSYMNELNTTSSSNIETQEYCILIMDLYLSKTSEDIITNSTLLCFCLIANNIIQKGWHWSDDFGVTIESTKELSNEIKNIMLHINGFFLPTLSSLVRSLITLSNKGQLPSYILEDIKDRKGSVDIVLNMDKELEIVCLGCIESGLHYNKSLYSILLDII